MRSVIRQMRMIIGCLTMLAAGSNFAQDWPQWRGPNRDAKATGFRAPKTWPKTLTQKWKVAVGNGVATPALVGNKLYVFARQDKDEAIACLDATSGKVLWEKKYEAKTPSGPARRFPGPRSSPAVADGKVVTLGARGTLSCFDAESGKELWRKTAFSDKVPRFFTSCSPIVVDGLCVVQLGGAEEGGIVAYDVATGAEKWKWTADGTAYSSPVVMTVDGTKAIVAETEKDIVGVAVADGKLLWKTPFAVQGRQAYNAATPVVDGQTVYFSGTNRGTKAIKIEKQGDRYEAKELWSDADQSVQFNTPVLKNGLLFGISARDFLFCINAQTGKTAWSHRFPGGRGFGAVLDVGPVLMALLPKAQLVVFEPTDKAFEQIVSYTVADEDTYAYPVAAGNRIYIKDRDSVTLWTIE